MAKTRNRITGIGMAIGGSEIIGILPCPHQLKPASNALIGPPPPTMSVKPRKIERPPNVTMNGGTFRRVIASPCSSPQSTPTPHAVRIAPPTPIPDVWLAPASSPPPL